MAVKIRAGGEKTLGRILPAKAKRPAADALAGTGAADQQWAIERAKREWECTADALAELVCLLDSAGRIIRANRVV